MKNFIKKIIGVGALAAFLIVPAVSFAATLNNDARDLPTLRAGNYTKNPTQDSINWTTSASADAGDRVNLVVYYHNTSSDTARNVRVRLTPQTTGTGTSHAFTVTISADNAPTVTGNATFTLSSGQSISFNGSTAWRPNQVTSGSTAFPSGQSGYDLFSSQGLNIGDVAPGWETQGNIFVAFMVSSSSTTTGSAPAIATNSATQVSGSGAMLNGYVNGNGLATNAWFEYGTMTSLGNSTPQYGYGSGASNFNAGLSNLASNTTYYFRAVAQNTQGLVYGSIYSFTTTGGITGSVPVVSTNSASNVTTNGAMLNGYVNNNGSAVNVWFEYGPTASFSNSTSPISYSAISSNYSTPISGLLSNTTYYFRAVAQNTQGTVYGSTYSFITTSSGSGVVIGGSAPVVTTLLATEIVGDIAKLNGLVFASSGQSSSAWFEWGTTTTLGNKTNTFNVGALPSIRHSDMLSGLTVGQKYYYRVVAENVFGKTYGAIMSFTGGSSSTNVVTNTTTRTTTTTRATTATVRTIAIPVTLALDGGGETVAPKEERAYRVSWKNESTQSLKNVVLRVTFPQSMTVKSADKGVILAADNAVALEIDTLTKGTTGEATINAIASRGLAQDELIVVTANMVYTDSVGVQGDVVAYVTQHGAIEQSQTASLFGTGEFLPTTVLGWALLLLLVLALVLLGNTLYGRMTVKA